ncbi:protein kinase [Streptomyces sp. T-3]|nr:protein kinase [Streptomyces sp. T-3]
MSDQQQPTPPYSAASGNAALEQAGATPLEPSDPGLIGPYVPLGRLGSGGMGRVYLARPADDSPGLAAVKVIRPEYAEDAVFRRRFEREAAVHAQVRTPHAPELRGTGFEDELLWMATQYLPGLNLSDATRECGRLEPGGVWRLVGELGQALSALAAAGIVHRDLKPSNVILSTHGAHVIDFGISQAAETSAITTTGARVGTPAFMAPEYLRDGRCDAASDVFSLASTLVHAATGHAPFGDGTGVDVMHRVAFEEPNAELMAELAAADPDLAALLAACLAKDPAWRPTARQLIDAATAQPRPPSWQEPLNSRLLARSQGSEVLQSASAHQTLHFRAPTRRGEPPAPLGAGPGGAALPPGFQGHRGSSGAQGSPGVQGAAGVHGSHGVQSSPGIQGSPGYVPVVAGGEAPSTGPGPGTSPDATPTHDYGPRRSRKPYYAVVAGLAVCAVALSAFLLTRPDSSDPAASPTPARTTAPADPGNPPPPSSDGASPSSSAKDKGKEKGDDGKDEGKGGTAGTAESPGSGTGDGEGGTQDDPTEGGTTTSGGGGSGGGTATTPAPTKTPDKPATPPWISQCTYYSGTAITRYGDTGQRVVQVQCMLTKRGYGVGSSGVDGEFGKDTTSAVKRFQTDKGLEVDGEVGPNTWAALRSST